MTRILSICGLVAVLGGAVVADALGHEGVHRVGGFISINTAGTSAFKGKVKSKRKFCFRNRLVVIKRDTPADKDPIIARDRTNAEGRYRAETSGPVTGDFYARATRKIKLVSGKGIICRPIQTSVIHID